MTLNIIIKYNTIIYNKFAYYISFLSCKIYIYKYLFQILFRNFLYKFIIILLFYYHSLKTDIMLK